MVDIFVRPPFAKCEACGAHGLGRLMVTGDQMIRKCKECLQIRKTNLPPTRKSVIYLDQFAVSNMMKSINPATNSHGKPALEPWSELYDHVARLVQMQLVVCPESGFHRLESRLEPTLGPAIQQVISYLSGRARFPDPEYILEKQLLDCLERWLVGEAASTLLDPRDVISDELDQWDDLVRLHVTPIIFPPLVQAERAIRSTAEEAMENLFRSWQQDPLPFRERFSIEIEAHRRAQVELYERRLFAPRRFPYSDSLLDAIKRQRPSAEAATVLFDFLRSEALEQVPILRIQASVHAALAVRAQGQKHPPNEGYMTDVEIVATLLPYCDAMLIDRVTYSLLNEPEVRRTLGGWVDRAFPPKQIDAFKLRLDTIEAGARANHARWVEWVYGTGALTANRHLFTTPGATDAHPRSSAGE